jgi:AraC family transcriptional regulator
MPTEPDLLPLLRDITIRLDGDVSLDALAARAGWSRFHLHRAFHRFVRETPKQYTLRLRLERAAALLLTTNETVLDIAVATGFASHEVFTRAFRRRFAETPVRYRSRATALSPEVARARHAALAGSAAPCVSLYHVSMDQISRSSRMPTLSIERRQIAAQPWLFVPMRVARHEISNAIGEGLGKAFPYAMKAGYPIAGRPTSRYLSTGPGLFSMEVGVPVAAAATGEGDVQAGTLPGGAVAVGMHAGTYESLGETYAAIERWIEAEGLKPGGAPWEAYITDPAEHPDPANWRTEVYWPLAE